ncbi:phenol hydroxylase [Pseudomonas putida S11]|nr:phenol hydroxylase [Pseudomonas putida S11]
MSVLSFASRLESGSSNKKNLRLAYHCAPHGYSLPLAARELSRTALQKVFELQNLRNSVDSLLLIRLLYTPDAHTKGKIFPDGHCWVQCIGLKDHRNVSFSRVDIINDLAINDKSRRW